MKIPRACAATSPAVLYGKKSNHDMLGSPRRMYENGNGVILCVKF